MGLRASESMSRAQSGKRDGAVYYAKSFHMIRVNPITFFTEDLADRYMAKYKVPQSKIYDMVLYYEDIYDKVDDDDFGKISYAPRTGCWPCLTRGINYLQWLKHFKPKLYWHLMRDRGLAKTLFSANAHKLGLAKPRDTINVKQKDSLDQITFFDTEETTSKCTSCNSDVEDMSAEEVLENISVEMMEMWITKRPCKFMSVG